MNQYYLIAQLPTLDALSDSAPMPITEEGFFELCSRFLNDRAMKRLEELTLTPKRSPEKSGDELIDKWNDGERRLRIALARVRAERMKKPFDSDGTDIPNQLMQVARTAAQMKDPLAAESYLSAYRLGFLESMRPSDPFCETILYYYLLKLKLLLRIRGFDEEKGRIAYRNKYSSILRGDEEAQA